MKKSLALAAIALLTVAPQSKAQTMIGKNEIKLKSDLKPFGLWDVLVVHKPHPTVNW